MASCGVCFNFLLLQFFSPSPLHTIFLFPLHLPPALLLGSGFWCNWRGGGARYALTAKSPENETSNQWCQQMTLCSTAPQPLKRGAHSLELCNDCLSSWHSDHTNFTKATKDGSPKIIMKKKNLYPDPAVPSAVSLFTVTGKMLEALKAREAELEWWSHTTWQLFISLITLQTVSQK